MISNSRTRRERAATGTWRGPRIAFGLFICANLAQPAYAQTAPPAPPPRVTIGYVEIAGDARYEPITGYGRLVLKNRHRPFAGAQVAVDDAQAIARVLKTEFVLERMTVASAAELASALTAARDSRGIHFFIADA